MKTALKTLALLLTIATANLALAQQTQNQRGQFQGNGTVASAVAMFGSNPTQFTLPQNGPWNPVVGQTQPTLTGIKIDPLTGKIVVQSKSVEVKASALDPNRDIVDPGSRRAMSSIQRDVDGTVYVIKKVTWTSYGVPHGKTTRRVIRGGGENGPGVVFDRTHEQYYRTIKVDPGSFGSQGPAPMPPTNDTASQPSVYYNESAEVLRLIFQRRTGGPYGVNVQSYVELQPYGQHNVTDGNYPVRIESRSGGRVLQTASSVGNGTTYRLSVTGRPTRGNGGGNQGLITDHQSDLVFAPVHNATNQ